MSLEKGWFYLIVVVICVAEQITYLSVEHPTVVYANPKYIVNVTTSARRHGRGNPIHYFSVEFTSLLYLGNNLTISLYFYEFLSNTYKRGFFELHFPICDFIEKDQFLGFGMKLQLNSSIHCPFRPGFYAFRNMSIPPAKIPKGFPFKKGRVYTNFTLTKTNELAGTGYIDIELRQMNANKYKPDLFPQGGSIISWQKF